MLLLNFILLLINLFSIRQFYVYSLSVISVQTSQNKQILNASNSFVSTQKNNYSLINKQFEKYQMPREYKENCQTILDCRKMAYTCSDRYLCECADGYRPDENNKSCVGAIGKRCMYDSHCITKAYCKGQTICTCKEEYPIVSEDMWLCQDDTDSKGHKINFFFKHKFIFILFVIFIYFIIF